MDDLKQQEAAQRRVRRVLIFLIGLAATMTLMLLVLAILQVLALRGLWQRPTAGLWLTLIAVVSWTTIPHLLLQRKRPVSTLAWLWAILLFPGAAALLYILLGTDRIRRKRLRRRAAFRHGRGREFFEGTCEVLPPTPLHPLLAHRFEGLPAQEQLFLQGLSRLQQLPIAGADTVEVLPNARRFYDRLLEAIAAATSYVHIETYIWHNDAIGKKLLAACLEAARRGVEVRVLLDEIGSWDTPARFFKPLMDAGGRFSWFLTLHPGRSRFFPNLRNHRKLQVIDGRIAFVGGMNIGDEYLGQDAQLGPWQDVQIALTGSAAAQLQEVFAEDWHFSTEEKLTDARYYPPTTAPQGALGQIVAGAPDAPQNPLSGSLSLIFGHACRRLWLTAGYFAPNEGLLSALQLAAARGVDVRLLVTEKSDHPYMVKAGRAFYEDLLPYGVRIFEATSGVCHAKIGVVDDAWAMVGSANLDYRSVRLNFELNFLWHAPPDNQELAAFFLRQQEQAREIHLAEFRRRGMGQRLQESVLRLLGPQL